MATLSEWTGKPRTFTVSTAAATQICAIHGPNNIHVRLLPLQYPPNALLLNSSARTNPTDACADVTMERYMSPRHHIHIIGDVSSSAQDSASLSASSSSSSSSSSTTSSRALPFPFPFPDLASAVRVRLDGGSSTVVATGATTRSSASV